MFVDEMSTNFDLLTRGDVVAVPYFLRKHINSIILGIAHGSYGFHE